MGFPGGSEGKEFSWNVGDLGLIPGLGRSLGVNTSFSFTQALKVPAVLGFPGSSAAKESTCNAGDPGLIPGLGSSPGEGIGYPLQNYWAFLVAQRLGGR